MVNGDRVDPHFSSSMSLPVLSTVVSFLDINDFSDFNGRNKLLSQLGVLTPEKGLVVSVWLKDSKFVLPVLSTIISFLDINEFQDCSGQIELFSALSDPVKLFVLVFWLKNTRFSVITHVDVKYHYSMTVYKRNGKDHRSNDEPATIVKNTCRENKRNEWFLCGKRHRKQGKPAIVFEDGSRVWLLNGGKSVRMAD